ncbi:MAG: DUF885 domain-containing protein [Elusimicrobiota bacterium]|jgi:uncharacterized protein (DUF885 family)
MRPCLLVLTLCGVSLPGAAYSQNIAVPVVPGAALGGLPVGAAGVPSAASDFSAFRQDFLQRLVLFRPDLGSTLGVPAAAARLADPSEAAVLEHVAYLEAAQSALAAQPAGAVSSAEAIDRASIRTIVESQLHELRDRKSYETDVSAGQLPYDSVVAQISQIEPGPRAAADWEAVVSRVEGIPLYLRRVAGNLGKGLRGGRHAYRGTVEKEGLEAGAEAADFFMTGLAEKAREQLDAASFAALAPRLEAAARAAAAAYEGQVRFLRAEVLPAAQEKYGVGAEEYAWKLKHELALQDSPRDLMDKGLRLAGEIRGRMEKLAGRIYPGKTLPEAMAELKKDHPADDAELLRTYAAVSDRARDFVISRGLFRLPADYRIQLIETPAGMRGSLASAAYFPAPPLDSGRKGVFLVTPSGGDQKRLSLHNNSRIPSTVVHEAFPGHDLQFWSFQHSPEISTVRYLLEAAGYAFSLNVEGYAFYAEELMRAKGFFTPKEELAQLGGQIWRAWRIVLDISLHLGLMSLDEVARVLTEEAFLPAPTAAIEAYRYVKMPTQAITYMLGRLQIEALKAEYRQVMGPAYDETEFHRLFLSFGPVLPAQIRPALLEEARRAASRGES